MPGRSEPAPALLDGAEERRGSIWLRRLAVPAFALAAIAAGSVAKGDEAGGAAGSPAEHAEKLLAEIRKLAKESEEAAKKELEKKIQEFKQTQTATQPEPEHSAAWELWRAREKDIEREIQTSASAAYISTGIFEDDGQSQDTSHRQVYEIVKASQVTTAEEDRARAIVEGRIKVTAAEREAAEATHAAVVQRQIAAQETAARVKQEALERRQAEAAKQLPLLRKAYEMATEREREVMQRTGQVPDRLLAAARAALEAQQGAEGGGAQPKHHHDSDARTTELELLRARHADVERERNKPDSSTYVSPERIEQARAEAAASAAVQQQGYENIKASQQTSTEEDHARAIVEGRIEVTAAEREAAEATHAAAVQRQIAAQEAAAQANQAERERRQAEAAKQLPLKRKAVELATEREMEVMQRTGHIPDRLRNAALEALPADQRPPELEGGGSSGSQE